MARFTLLLSLMLAASAGIACVYRDGGGAASPWLVGVVTFNVLAFIETAFRGPR